MKILFKRFFSLFVVMFIFVNIVFAATEKFGAEITNRKVTSIEDILSNPKSFEGKIVTIEGVIDSECPSGCFFYVRIKDKNATINVNIAPAGFVIPQKTGSKVLVEGKVVLKGVNPIVLGTGVEIQ